MTLSRWNWILRRGVGSTVSGPVAGIEPMRTSRRAAQPTAIFRSGAHSAPPFLAKIGCFLTGLLPRWSQSAGHFSLTWLPRADIPVCRFGRLSSRRRRPDRKRQRTGALQDATARCEGLVVSGTDLNRGSVPPSRGKKVLRRVLLPDLNLTDQIRESVRQVWRSSPCCRAVFYTVNQ